MKLRKFKRTKIRTVGARPANLAQKKQENHHLVFKFDKNLDYKPFIFKTEIKIKNIKNILC